MEQQPNPYQTPQAAVQDPARSYHDSSMFAFSGRIGRVRYIAYSWGVSIALVLAAIAVGGALAVLAGSDGAAAVTVVLAYIPLVVFSFVWAVRRLNDLDWSGWLSLLLLIPLVNLVLGIMLMVMPGTPGANRYGEPHKPNSRGIIALAVLAPVVFVVGLLAAIVVPAYSDYQQRAEQLQSVPTEP